MFSELGSRSVAPSRLTGTDKMSWLYPSRQVSLLVDNPLDKDSTSQSRRSFWTLNTFILQLLVLIRWFC